MKTEKKATEQTHDECFISIQNIQSYTQLIIQDHTVNTQ